MLHDKSKGDILVYMDDDDYYPPTRISHAVNMLTTHSKALCAGSSELYIWFKHIQKMYKFGPYGPNHATAGTFAFKRELLNQTRYNENACLAEEKEFLKNYTIPFVQLDPKHSILVFSHIHNTFDKKTLLENPNPKVVNMSDKTVDDFILPNQHVLKDFYTNKIDTLLQDYEPGRPEMKPDVIAQTKELTRQREQMQREAHEKFMKENPNSAKQQQQSPQIMMNHPQFGQVVLSNQQIIELLNKLQNDLQQTSILLKNKDSEIQVLTTRLEQADLLISSLKKKIMMIQ